MGKHTSYLYDDDDTDLYVTDGYSGSDADVAGTEVFTDDIDLTVRQGAEVHFKFDGDNATDDLLLTVYKRNDATWTGNEAAWKAAKTVDNDGTETEYHFSIPAQFTAGHYRFGMVRSGSTTTFDIHVTMRRWRPTQSIA
jgi:hypothetical protein